MSQTLENFKTAAKARNWAEAYKLCNGLNMPEMLDGLNSLGTALLTDLDAQAPLHAGAVFMARIQYAIDVVLQRKLPATAPGDLETTGQVEQARKWLATHATGAVKQKKLRITLYWTKKAQREDASPALLDKAQKVLRDNGDEFILDVLPLRSILDTDKEQWEGSSDNSCKDNDEFMELYELVKKSKTHDSKRLPVIFYRSQETLGPRGEVNEPLQHGCGCHLDDGKAFVLINVRKQAADKVTLLHELGHAANNGHEFGDEENFMSYGRNRTKINPIQKKKFEASFFSR